MRKKWVQPSEALNRRFFELRAGDSLDEDEEELQIIRRLGFRVGDMGLLIAAETISELTEIMAVCAIPNTAPWLLGLVNLRGNLVPVFEMAMILNIEANSTEKRMLLILGEGDAAAGILIDGLPAHQSLTSADEMESLPALPGVIKPYIPSAYEQEGTIWFNFDHLGFFQSLAVRVAL
ncbi:MAG: hypothetical protein GY862_24565 [Gammaproteobacteria bacterium]|nr:hypothetical protein [Gammaproteobacteria bacterium]